MEKLVHLFPQSWLWCLILFFLFIYLIPTGKCLSEVSVGRRAPKACENISANSATWRKWWSWKIPPPVDPGKNNKSSYHNSSYRLATEQMLSISDGGEESRSLIISWLLLCVRAGRGWMMGQLHHNLCVVSCPWHVFLLWIGLEGDDCRERADYNMTLLFFSLFSEQQHRIGVSGSWRSPTPPRSTKCWPQPRTSSTARRSTPKLHSLAGLTPRFENKKHKNCLFLFSIDPGEWVRETGHNGRAFGRHMWGPWQERERSFRLFFLLLLLAQLPVYSD